jgi:anti-sigma B factor antagonist
VEIKLRRSSTIYIIDIIGEMDLYNSFKLKDVLGKMIQKNIRHFIINLDQVEYLDSSGVGSLIYAHSELKKRKMLLRIVNVKGSVKKVIELTKLNGYFQIAQNVAEGIRQISELI